MSSAVIAIEGVLGESPDFSITMQPTPAGREFFEALQAVYRIILVTSQPDATKVEHWLRSNWFRGYSQALVGVPEALTHQGNRTAQIRALRASRTAVSLFVDTDSEAVAYAARVGITGLLWTPAMRGAQREDLQAAPIRSWEEMVPADPRIPVESE